MITIGSIGLQVKNPERHGMITYWKDLNYVFLTGRDSAGKKVVDHWQKIRAENPETRTIVTGRKIRL